MDTFVDALLVSFLLMGQIILVIFVAALIIGALLVMWFHISKEIAIHKFRKMVRKDWEKRYGK